MFLVLENTIFLNDNFNRLFKYNIFLKCPLVKTTIIHANKDLKLNSSKAIIMDLSSILVWRQRLKVKEIA